MKKMERFHNMNLKKIIFAAAIVFAAWGGISTEMTVSATQVENESSKSPDNSLSSLKLSKGTLSPEFYYSTTSYTATVPYETTSLEVTAETSNSKAEIESISGASDLQPGENKITITVRAENGAKALYTIKVTRESSSTGTSTGETTTGEAGEVPGTGETIGEAGEAPTTGETTGEAGEAPATGETSPEQAGDVEGEEYSAQIEEYENRISLLQKEYEKLEKKYESEKSSARTIIAILIFLLIVVIIAGINMVIYMKRSGRNGEDIEEEEELDIEEENDWLDEEDEEIVQREMPFTKKKTVEVMETTDDIEMIDVIDFDKL